MKQDKIIDVDYKDYAENLEKEKQKIINGEPLFYTTSQVAQMLGVEPSKVRFYTKRFDKLLDIELSNRNRQYKKTDIEKLKFIIKLKNEDGLTLQQIEDYCSKKGFNMQNIEQGIVDSTNPLAIKTIMSALTVEIDEKLNLFSENLLKQIQQQQENTLLTQQKINEKLQENIVTTVDEIVSEKLDAKFNEFQSHLATQEQQVKERDTEILDTLRKGMEERQKAYETKQEKKGFFSKLFGNK